MTMQLWELEEQINRHVINRSLAGGQLSADTAAVIATALTTQSTALGAVNPVPTHGRSIEDPGPALNPAGVSGLTRRVNQIINQALANGLTVAQIQTQLTNQATALGAVNPVPTHSRAIEDPGPALNPAQRGPPQWPATQGP
jgi:hypothetical protein